MLEHWDSTWFNQQRQVFNSWTKRIATLLGEWVWVSGDEIFVSCWMGWWDCKNPQTQGWLGDHLKKTCFGTLYRMMFVFRKVNHNIYLENCTVFFLIHYWVLPVADVFLFNCVFWWLWRVVQILWQHRARTSSDSLQKRNFSPTWSKLGVAIGYPNLATNTAIFPTKFGYTHKMLVFFQNGTSWECSFPMT